MSIKMLRAGNVFDEETTRLLGTAFDLAWAKAQSRRKGDDVRFDEGMRESLATHILAVGRQGERDLAQIVERALARLTRSAVTESSAA